MIDPEGGVPAPPYEHWPSDLPSQLVCLHVDDVRGECEQVADRDRSLPIRLPLRVVTGRRVH